MSRIPLKSTRSEFRLLVVLGAITVLGFAFTGLAWEVLAGKTLAIDRALLLALRRTGDLSTPIGPHWLESAFVSVTAFGGTFVIALIMTISVLYLLLERRYTLALLLGVSVAAGHFVESAMKLQFHRPRPDVVPHLVTVISPSFPSGHAMLSTITYLTLGLLLVRSATTFRIKVFIVGTSAFLALIIGISRVYLGVHWPTDVVAGWMAGAVWVFGFWLVLSKVELMPS